MRVLVVEPDNRPYVKEIPAGLDSLQSEVGGLIQAVYPFDDPVAIICNDEGKINGLPLNRALDNEDEGIYDIIAGTFLVAGLGDEDFISLTPELIEKYSARFRNPETFRKVNGQIVIMKKVS